MKAGDRIIVKCTKRPELTGMRGIILKVPPKILSRSLIDVKLYGHKENKIALYAYRLNVMPTILNYQIY